MPDAHPLDSAWTKLHWAQRHLDLLYKEAAAFYGNQHQASGSENDSEASNKTVYKPFRPPPTIPWSLIVADAIFNMRCALDHIAYALAVQRLKSLNLSRPPTRDTAFPIFNSPNAGNFARLTADIEPDARQVIDALQPYERRNNLWIVAELSNVDKHERLNVFPAMIAFTGKLTISPGNVVNIDLADGGIVTTDPVSGKPKKEFDPDFTPSVSLKMVMPRSGTAFDASILQEIQEFIRGAVFPPLARFFPTTSKPHPSTGVVPNGTTP